MPLDTSMLNNNKKSSNIDTTMLNKQSNTNLDLSMFNKPKQQVESTATEVKTTTQPQKTTKEKYTKQDALNWQVNRFDELINQNNSKQLQNLFGYDLAELQSNPSLMQEAKTNVGKYTFDKLKRLNQDKKTQKNSGTLGKFLGKISQTGNEFAFGDEIPQEFKISTDNKGLDILASLLGGVKGLTLPTGNETLLGAAQKVSIPISQKVGSKGAQITEATSRALSKTPLGEKAIKNISNITPRLAEGAVREGIEGSILGATQGIAAGNSIEDVSKKTAEGAAIGGAFGAGIEGVSPLIRKLLNRNVPVENLDDTLKEVQANSKNITKNIPKKLIPIKENKELNNVIKEYNDAIQEIQNYFGTNELTPNEQAMIKPVLGIDLEDIMKRWEKAQNKSVDYLGDLRNISQNRKIANVAGVEELPNVKLGQTQNIKNINTSSLIQNANNRSLSNVQLSRNTNTQNSIISKMPKAATGEGLIKRSEIENFLKENLDIPIKKGKFREKAQGIFKVNPEVVRLKSTKDLDTLFHEVGHFLDKKMSLSTIDELENNILQLAPKKGYEKASKDVLKQEGIAEFFRYYIANEQLAKKEAPELFEALDPIIKQDNNLSSMISTVRKGVNNYVNADPQARLLSNVSVGEKEAIAKPTLDKLYTLTVDDLTPLNKAVKNITGGTDVPVSKDPYRLAILNKSSGIGKARTFIEYGQVDENLNKVGKSLNDILKPISKNLDDFRSYAIAKRAKELSERGIETGIKKSDIDSVLSKHANKNYNKVMDDLVKYQDNLLNQLVDSGVLSKDAVTQMRKLNKNYIPFYRVIDKTSKGIGKRLTDVQNPVKGIKGSERDIIDPLESIIKNTYFITNVAERNRVGKSLVELASKFEGSGKILDKVPPKMVGQQFQLSDIKKALSEAGADVENINLDNVASIFRPQGYFGKDNVITVYRNGKPEYYQLFDQELFNTLTNLNKNSTSTLLKIMSYPSKLLRSGAVLTPEFALRNPVRDAMTTFIYSKYGFTPGVDTLKGLFHVLKKDDMYYKAMSSGALNNSLVSLDRNYLQKNLRQILGQTMKDKKLNIITKPIEILRAITEFTEEATRLGEFAKGVKKEGMSLEGLRKSALSSRDLMDFLRGGTLGKEANKAIPFFNAQIQGIDKMVRAFKDNPIGTTGKAIAGITLPSIALYMKNKDDPRYQELPRWQKDLFWIIPTKDVIYRIPKPFEMGLLFGTMPERVMEYLEKQDPKAFKGLGTRMFENLAPNLAPTFYTVPFELKANKSLFFDSSIVPQSEQRLKPSEQYGAKTSETSKLLGKLINQSPRKIDYAVRGFTGGLGTSTVGLLDKLVGTTGIADSKVKEKKQLATVLPGIKGMALEPYKGSTQSMEDFYDGYNKLEEEYNTKRVRQGINLNQYEKANELRQYRAVAQELSKIRNIIRTIQESKELSPEQKKTGLDKLNLLMTNLARTATGKEPIK